MKTSYLISYDISRANDGAARLRRVARVCEGAGHRVQSSVFECRLTKRELYLLLSDLEAVIDPALDSVLVYAVRGDREAALGHSS